MGLTVLQPKDSLRLDPNTTFAHEQTFLAWMAMSALIVLVALLLLSYSSGTIREGAPTIFLASKYVCQDFPEHCKAFRVRT